MKLRGSIKPPARFGELESEDSTAAVLQSMRRARENGCDRAQDLVQLANEGSDVVIRQRPPKHKPQDVPFDPVLAPAAFPTIGALQPNNPDKTRQDGATDRPQGTSVNNGDNNVEMFDVEESVPLGAIENYVSSNTTLNPVYVKNMKTMAASGQHGNESFCNLSDSDLDEPVDDSVRLGAKVADPTWSDINPALQVEIVESLLKESGWRKVCSKLGLDANDRKKFASYLDTRNKQILRENQRLDDMRRKQLQALMRIDNSDIKRNDVPHQLVLRRLTRVTTKGILSKQYTDLLMCRAADVLTARQYLHRRSLARSLAGDWGHSLVVLRGPESNDLDPERFEWQENLSLLPELLELKSLPKSNDELDTQSKHDFIQRIGRRNTVNPADLMRRANGTSPVRDWGHQFPFRFPEWKPLPQESPKRKRQSDGMIRLKVGVEKAAQIRQLGEGGAPLMHVPSAQLSSPLAAPVVTPSKVHFGPLTKEESNAKLPAALCDKWGKPVTRSLGGVWSMNTLDPSTSQARFTRKMNMAKLEADQQRLADETKEQGMALLNARQRALALGPNHANSPSSKLSFADGIFAGDEALPCLGDVLAPTQTNSQTAFSRETAVSYEALFNSEITNGREDVIMGETSDVMEMCDSFFGGDEITMVSMA